MNSLTYVLDKITKNSYKVNKEAPSFLNLYLNHTLKSGFQYEGFIQVGNSLVLFISSQSATACCSCCGYESSNIHGYYQRIIKDVPIGDHQVILSITVRKFFCKNKDCPRHIFSEDISLLAVPYGRMSVRAERQLLNLSRDMPANDAAKNLRGEGIPVSASTCLRHLKRSDREALCCGCEFVGIDDFASKKGHIYCSVVVNLLTHKVVAVIPCRSGKELDEWLKANPQIKFITRDRGQCFIQSINEHLPYAHQICDRFHLVKNLTDTMTEVIKKLLSPKEKPFPVPRPTEEEARASIEESILSMGDKRQRETARIRWDGLELKAKGYTTREIADRLGVPISRVYRVLNKHEYDKSLNEKQRKAKSMADKLAVLLSQGCTSIELMAKRMGGEVDTGLIGRITFNIREKYRLKRKETREHNKRIREKSRRDIGPKKISMSEIRDYILGKPSEIEELDMLKKADEHLSDILDICVSFRKMIAKEWAYRDLDGWIQRAKESKCKALENFAYGIECDKKAVFNAITLPFSNGLLEGTVNKIKSVKRDMYNKASIDLLRVKLIGKTSYKDT